MKLRALLLSAVLAALLSPALAAQGLVAGSLPADDGVLPPGAEALRFRAVRLDAGLLEASAAASRAAPAPPLTLTLDLFDDVRLTAVMDLAAPAVPEGVVWTGRIEGAEHGEVTLVVRDGAVTGHIWTPSATYEIRPAAGGAHVVYEVDRRSPAPCAPPVPVDIPGGTASVSRALRDDGSTIDILVVYTQTAREMNGGTEGIEALVNLAVQTVNNAFANSGIAPRVNLVHTAEVAFEESTQLSYDLDCLQYGAQWAEGDLAEVHSLRERYQADLVSMFVYSGYPAGIAYQMNEASTAFADHAFSVVKTGYAVESLTFPHEISHNMGCAHDRNNIVNPGEGLYPYSYGYQDPVGGFYTVMAYENGCGGSCVRIPHFSNPDVFYEGRPTGVDYQAADAADNALSLNSIAPIVANFRNRSGAPTPTPLPGSMLDVTLSGGTISPGDPLTVEVTVQPIGRAFDAWGVILGPGASWSFILGNPSAVRPGLTPLATNVPGLSSPYAGTLLSLVSIPAGIEGNYTVIVGLVPPGVSPSGVADAIPGYVDREDLIVQY